MKLAEVPILILAGGKATRLAHLAKDRAKYLQPITDNAVFADIHLNWVKAHGFRRVILGIGHLGAQIRAHCGNGAKYGLEISYVDDGDQPLGTGGAVRASLPEKYETLAVTYGDTLLKVDVSRFISEFSASGEPAGMTLYKNTVPGHVCNADLQGSRARYNKSAPDPRWAYIDYGFLAMKRGAIEAFPTATPLDLADPLARLSEQGHLFGFEISERFWEIGSPEALSELQEAYRKSLRDDFGSFLKL